MHKRLKHYLGRRIVAVLEDGSLAGIVAAAGREECVLTSPTYLAPDGARPIDGEVVLPYATIKWVQVA